MPSGSISWKAYDICTTKLFVGNFEHVFELVPHDHVGFDKDRTRLSDILVDELLSFWPQGKVGNHDIAILLQEQFGKAVVDACQ